MLIVQINKIKIQFTYIEMKICYDRKFFTIVLNNFGFSMCELWAQFSMISTLESTMPFFNIFC